MSKQQGAPGAAAGATIVAETGLAPMVDRESSRAGWHTTSGMPATAPQHACRCASRATMCTDVVSVLLMDGRIIVVRGALWRWWWWWWWSRGGGREGSSAVLGVGGTEHPARCALAPQGLLRGFDQAVNLILVDAKERVYSSKAGVEVVPLGLYMVRGDNV